jgi:hypothetical protein
MVVILIDISDLVHYLRLEKPIPFLNLPPSCSGVGKGKETTPLSPLGRAVFHPWTKSIVD